MKSVSLFSILALSVPISLALPQVSPRPGLLSIVVFYTADQCSKTTSNWALSTGTESWHPYLEEHNGCQPINATWDIASAMVGYLGQDCSVSLYTDKECKENAVTPELGACAANSQAKFKSFSLRNCAEVKT